MTDEPEPKPVPRKESLRETIGGYLIIGSVVGPLIFAFASSPMYLLLTVPGVILGTWLVDPNSFAKKEDSKGV